MDPGLQELLQALTRLRGQFFVGDQMEQEQFA
jgi:hypothetical protein